ncbi:MAG: response regulator [Candidatus Mariimomonas ferrooxydans]
MEEERVDIRNIPVGNETILLVEDEDLVRASTVKILQSLGYEVIAARDANEALSKYKEYNGMIHLLLSDVIIPDMSSRDLSERLKKLSPELKVLFVSGYTGNVIAKHGILESGLSFLQEPFSKAALAHKIREVLES